jgi:hypothetical protein
MIRASWEEMSRVWTLKVIVTQVRDEDAPRDLVADVSLSTIIHFDSENIGNIDLQSGIAEVKMGAARSGDSRVDVTRAQCAVKPLRLSFPLAIDH